MKIFLAVLLCLATVAVRAQDRDNRRGGDQAGHGGKTKARPLAPKALRLSPNSRARPSGAFRPPEGRYDLKSAPDHRVEAGRSEHPDRNERAGFHAPDHNGIAGLAGFAAGAFAREASERLVNHAYWHTDNNTRYAHMYDGHVHWYGLYNGPRFYWTRYEDNRWWYYDQSASRWLYWHDNHWWWHNPDNPSVPYIVVNDNYYPYSETEIAPQPSPAPASPNPAPAPVPAPSVAVTPVPAPAPVPTPAIAAPPSPAPTPAPQPQSETDVVRAHAASAMAELDKAAQHDRIFVSPDSAREVRIAGDQREASLYDRTGGGAPRLIGVLASGVKRAQFSEANGNHIQVLLLMNDGSYDVFDADGHSQLQPATGDDSGSPSPSTQVP